MYRTLALRPVARPMLVAAMALALTGLAIALAPSAHNHDTASAASRANRSTFHDAMRQLWEDHIVWTRMAIIGIVDDRPDQSLAVERLLRNQDDIGDAIKPFYGEAAGNELTRLLREHIFGAADLLVAAKTGVGFEAAHEAWYANGAEIGAFLADANPRNWDRAEMQAMMADHLDLTLAEAVARLQGNYAADVAAYDEIHAHILHMADMLSDGIVAQFPARFGR
ncbi:MAG TPA: hypothetical protein VHK63_02660 [Candidatus Limnocylindria bacterium]|nr:hypothetical protein [Candidatus Limnocylindria bacterium]